MIVLHMRMHACEKSCVGANTRTGTTLDRDEDRVMFTGMHPESNARSPFVTVPRADPEVGVADVGA